MNCVDHFEYKGFELPLNLSKYIRGGSVVVGCVKKLHYLSSDICDGASHLECSFPWVVGCLLLLVVVQGLALWHFSRKKFPLKCVSPSPADKGIEMVPTAPDESPTPSPRISPRASIYPKIAAVAGATFLANGALDMTSILGVKACSQVFPLGDTFDTCVDSVCKTQWVYSLSVNNGDEICVPTVNGLVSLGTLYVTAESTPDFVLESSDWSIKVLNHRDCYGHGFCGDCSEAEVRKTWVIHNETQKAGCFSKCGCVSCGCASCGQSCLFWHASVKPVGSRYAVSRYTEFSYGLSVRSGSDYKFLDQRATIKTALGTLSLESLSPPPVGTICLKQGKLLDTETCRPNMEGPFGVTFDGPRTLFDVSRIHCTSPTTDTVDCGVSNTGLNVGAFDLPHFRSGYVVESRGEKIIASLRRPLSISLFLLRDEVLPLKFVSDNKSCNVEHYEKHGCFNCEEGFVILLTMGGHGHCYFQESGLGIINTLVDCGGSSYLHGYTTRHTLPDLTVCGQVLTFEGQLSAPKVMQEDGSWTGVSETSNSWWSPLLSLRSFSLKTTLTTLLTCLALLLGFKLVLSIKKLFYR